MYHAVQTNIGAHLSGSCPARRLLGFQRAVLMDDALEECEEKVVKLEQENDELRKSAQEFGQLAERLNQMLRHERRREAEVLAPPGESEPPGSLPIGPEARRPDPAEPAEVPLSRPVAEQTPYEKKTGDV